MASIAADPGNKPTPLPAPLGKLRVLDLTVALAGPYCTLLLGGLGAEVIKIDAPGGSDIARLNPPYVGPEGLNYEAPRHGETSLSVFDRHRNKKSITLDLKSPEGLSLFRELVRSADVVVENFSEGTPERLGIGYDDLASINPHLIYASISALGGSRAHGNIKGMDIVVQALSGVMEVNGFPDGPPCRVGFPLADLVAPHYATIGILSALVYRANGGGGQHIQVNLLDSLVSLLALEHYDLLVADKSRLRTGNHHERLTPFGVFATRDGYIAIAAPTDGWTRMLFAAMEMPDMASDPRFATRGARAMNAAAMNQLIEQWSRQHDTATAVKRLVDGGVPSVPVRSPSEAFADPEIIARGAVVPLRNAHLPESIVTAAPGVPIRFSACTVGYDHDAPLLGEDNEDVYRNVMGLSAEQIADFRKGGII